jgi:thiol peroxidase
MAVRVVTLGGRAHALVGYDLHVGRPAPQFMATDPDLHPYAFASVAGTPCILSSVPSLDFGGCGAQVEMVDREVAGMGTTVTALALTMDLPFSIRKWVLSQRVAATTVLSDYRDASFGIAYGLLIGELRLLGRALLVVDADRIVTHMEVTQAAEDEPDCRAALAALRALA